MANLAAQKANLPPTFFDTYRPEIGKVFNVVDVPIEALGSLDAAVEATQPWVAGDHSRPDYEFDIDPEQSIALNDLYDQCGLRESHELPDDKYDHILVFGATHIGNNRRLEFLYETLGRGGITAAHITLLGGQRLVYPEVEDRMIEENVQQLVEQGSTDPWLKKVEADRKHLKWETDLIRLAALAKLGPMALQQVHVRLNNPDLLRALEFDWQGKPLMITHSLAHPRPNGEPRHTTETCLEDWLRTVEPEHGVKVAFIAANPHIERMGKTVHAILRKLGREDLQTVIAGAAAHGSYGHPIFLGEIARNLYEDQRLLQAR